MKLVAATNNPGKLAEMRAILTDLGFEVLSSEEAGYCGEIKETGTTFEENAMIKAETVMRATGLAALADDSGLEVDALGGEPGVYSARYAEPGGRKKKVLEKMREVPDGKRTARFVAAIACAFPDGGKYVVRGTCEGEILRECRGEGGFGYDPLFYVPEYGMTFAEMTAELKNRISHRSEGLHKMAEALRGRIH